MAFGNSQQNNYTELSKNTKGIQFYNSDPIVGSVLVTGFWNNFVTVKICPLLPEKDRSQTRVYNYENYINTALNTEKAMTLYTGIMTNIIPVLDSGSYDFKSIGVPVGSGFIEVSNGEKHEIDKNNIVLTLFSKVDTEGKCEELLNFVFLKKPYFYNYDNKSGSIESQYDEIDFLIFVGILKEFIKASTNAIAHSIRNCNKYETSKTIDANKAIMNKLGVSFSNSNYNKNNRGQSKFFNSNNSNSDTGLEENEIKHDELGEEEDRLPF